jgi:hypothetical protein
LGKELAGKSATQRATKVAAGGFSVNAIGTFAKELTNQESRCPAINSSTVTTVSPCSILHSRIPFWQSSVSNAVFCGSSFMWLSFWLTREPRR